MATDKSKDSIYWGQHICMHCFATTSYYCLACGEAVCSRCRGLHRKEPCQVPE